MRPTYPDYINDAFTRDVARHEITILRDDPPYRHVMFRCPNTGIGRFDLVTWPGYLTICGDRDTYTFARECDMFGFFREGELYVRSINPHYWAEKITDCRERAKVYSRELAEQAIWRGVRELYGQYGARAKGLAKDVKDRLIDDWNSPLDFEESAREFITNFTYRTASKTSDESIPLRFTDVWEWDIRDWDYHYLWSCHAIKWGIARYDEYKLRARDAETKETTSA